MATLNATYGMETDHLLAIVERMQQAGHTERQISAMIGRSLRPARRGWSAQLREAGRRLRRRGGGGSGTAGRLAAA